MVLDEYLKLEIEHPDMFWVHVAQALDHVPFSWL